MHKLRYTWLCVFILSLIFAKAHTYIAYISCEIYIVCVDLQQFQMITYYSITRPLCCIHIKSITYSMNKFKLAERPIRELRPL